MLTFRATDYRDWDDANLLDYGDFADCVTFCLCSEYGDGQEEGEWYYIDTENRTIYYGSFGNYNSPGASDYTYADCYGPDEGEEFAAAVREWESKPEYVEDAE